MKKKLKQFVVRKYVMATSARAAIAQEKKQEADDVWLDEDWKKATIQSSPITGFNKQ